MKLVTHDRLQSPRVLKCTRAVVYDKHDNPLAVAVEMQDGFIFVATAEDPQWNKILQELSIRKVLVVENLQQKPLDQVRFG